LPFFEPFSFTALIWLVCKNRNKTTGFSSIRRDRIRRKRHLETRMHRRLRRDGKHNQRRHRQHAEGMARRSTITAISTTAVKAMMVSGKLSKAKNMGNRPRVLIKAKATARQSLWQKPPDERRLKSNLRAAGRGIMGHAPAKNHFGEMRSGGGPIGILVYYADYRCSHSIRNVSRAMTR
jgi:hypothetical protein